MSAVEFGSIPLDFYVYFQNNFARLLYIHICAIWKYIILIWPLSYTDKSIHLHGSYWRIGQLLQNTHFYIKIRRQHNTIVISTVEEGPRYTGISNLIFRHCSSRGLGSLETHQMPFCLILPMEMPFCFFNIFFHFQREQGALNSGFSENHLLRNCLILIKGYQHTHLILLESTPYPALLPCSIGNTWMWSVWCHRRVCSTIYRMAALIWTQPEISSQHP